MRFHLNKKRQDFTLTESSYWRSYFALWLVGFVVLLGLYDPVEALFYAWLLVDAIGLVLLLLFAFCFIIDALLTRLQAKSNPRI